MDIRNFDRSQPLHLELFRPSFTFLCHVCCCMSVSHFFQHKERSSRKGFAAFVNRLSANAGMNLLDSESGATPKYVISLFEWFAGIKEREECTVWLTSLCAIPSIHSINSLLQFFAISQQKHFSSGHATFFANSCARLRVLPCFSRKVFCPGASFCTQESQNFDPRNLLVSSECSKYP